MKRTGLLFVGVIAGTVLALAFVLAPSQSSLAVFSNANRPAARPAAARLQSTSTPLHPPHLARGATNCPPQISPREGIR